MIELSKTSWHYKLLTKFNLIDNQHITICSYITNLISILVQLTICISSMIMMISLLLYGLYGVFDIYALHNTEIPKLEGIGILLWGFIAITISMIGIVYLILHSFATLQEQKSNLFSEVIRAWKDKVCVFVTFK